MAVGVQRGRFTYTYLDLSLDPIDGKLSFSSEGAEVIYGTVFLFQKWPGIKVAKFHRTAGAAVLFQFMNERASCAGDFVIGCRGTVR